MEFTVADLLDDLIVANERLLKFEQQYQMSSTEFYALYSSGLLDDGENMEDKAQWSAFYEILRERRVELEQMGVLEP